jgi:hypothetical protein
VNNLRDDWDAHEPGLSPAVLQSGHFGQLFNTPVDGQVYAQPLVVDTPGTATTPPTQSVIVATENDTVYSIDGTTGKVNWSNHLATAWASSVKGCNDLAPLIGITSTPVYDPATGDLYVVAMNAGPSATNPHPAYYIYAVNEQTGAIDWHKLVSGRATNNPSVGLSAVQERQRTGLLLMNGWLYFGFASFCDFGNYIGLVAGVNETSQAETMWVDEAGSATDNGGIWMSGSGLMSDASGRLFLATGNGISPPPSAGNRPPTELGDSVVRLNQNTTTGALTAADYFSPANAPTLDRQDGDLGAGGTVGLPFGTSVYPHLLIQAGKDHRIFLLNRDNLGGRNATTDHPVFTGGPYGGQWGHPAAYAGTGADWIYYSGSGEGSADYLRVLKFNGHTPSNPILEDTANSPAKFGFTSGSPVVTSNGHVDSSAIVWEVYTSGSTGASGQLEAFNAVPAAGKATLTQLWSAPIGTAAKFSVPATDGGHVYVGTRSDSVYGFGVSNAIPLTGTPVSFGSVAVGATPQTVNETVTASQSMEVTSLAASSTASTNPFTVGTPLVNGVPVTTFPGTPIALTSGATLTVPITFTPTTADSFTGSLDIGTNVTGYPTVSIPLTATGTAAGLAAFPASLPFGFNNNIPDSEFNGPVPTGGTQTFEVNITNTGTKPETITSIRPPAAPFSISGLKTGTVLGAGQATVVAVTYTPSKAASSDTGSFTIGDSTGHSVTVPLTGVSVTGGGVLVSSATQVNFGAVRVGSSSTDIVRIVNTGNLPVTVSLFLTPPSPFGTPVPIARGLTISPNDTVTLPVNLTPRVKGTFSGAYQIAATYGNGKVVKLTLHVSGSAS